MEEYQRKNDAIIADLSRGFNDFLERYDRDQMRSDAWRKSFETKVNCVQKSVSTLMIPYKVMTWVFGGGLVAASGLIVAKIFDWIQTHIKLQ